MSRSKFFTSSVVSILCVAMAITGCAPRQPIYLSARGEVARHLRTHATEIEYPDTNVPSISEVENAMAPFSLENSQPREEWLLNLENAVAIALENSKVVRTLNGVSYSAGGVFGSPSVLLSSPNSIVTTWDPALVETDPRYGMAAALSAFDAQFQSQVGWTKERSVDPYSSNVADNFRDTGVWQSTLSKTAATGGMFYVTNDNRYTDRNVQFTSSGWTTYMEGGFTQPLLKGSGLQFNRIAGPNAIAGFNNGIMIARINEDVSLANFEIAVRNLVADVEKAYWNLAFAYYSLDSVVSGRDAALQTWQQVRAHKAEGGTRGSGQAESQARQQYLLFKGQAETSQSNLFQAESKLRYILGIAATDGRMIKPISPPTTAPMKYDYRAVIAEALARSPELRMQKWDIRKKELELVAQKNFTLPQLDLKANYRWNGSGRDLINLSNERINDNPLVGNDMSSSAYGSMTHDGLGTWGTSLTFSMPLGFRQGHAAVRNAQLACAKSRAILQEQELELTHQLADTYRDLSQYYVTAQTYYDRIESARDEVELTQASYELGKTSLYEVLDAQRRLAESETQYYRTLIDYNIALSTLHLRKGSILEYNNVALAEGPWPAKAVFHDAVLQARKRDAGHYMNYGYTAPRVISQGPYNQFQYNEQELLAPEQEHSGYLMETYPATSPATYPMSSPMTAPVAQPVTSSPTMYPTMTPTLAPPLSPTLAPAVGHPMSTRTMVPGQTQAQVRNEWETARPFADGAFRLPDAPASATTTRSPFVGR